MTSLNNKFWGFWKNWIHNSFHIKFYSYTLILTFRALCGKPVKNPLLGLKRALDYPCTGHFRFLWCVPEINVLWVAALYKNFAWAEKSCVIATFIYRLLAKNCLIKCVPYKLTLWVVAMKYETKYYFSILQFGTTFGFYV